MAKLPGQSGDSRKGHPDVDELIGYVRGELTQPEAGSVRTHASTCIDCGDQLAALILLREAVDIDAEGGAPTAKVIFFPVPAKAGAPRWKVGKVGVAVAASLLVLLGGVGWWAQLGGPSRATTSGPHLPPAIEFDRFETDVGLVMGTAEFMTALYNPALQTAVGGAPTDARRVALGLEAVGNRDLPEALRVLDPFISRWDGDGTAVVGCVLFLQGDPLAYQVLEMYAADHRKQVRRADADGAEGLAFFFLARLRHALGRDDDALEALRWIEPGGETGRAAAQWSEATFGDRGRPTGEHSLER